MDDIIMRDNLRDFKQESTPLKQNPSSPTTTTSRRPSAASSPTHDFSFTFFSTYDTNNNIYKNSTSSNSTLPPPQPPAAIDLSPAGDIFFAGQLLPLHDGLPAADSPRSSTNSMDSFTLPTNLLYHQYSNPIGNTSFHCHHQTTTFSDIDELSASVTTINQNRPKSKSFSVFGIPKWKKSSDDDEDQTKERNGCKKRTLDLGQLIKRYMKMARPLLTFQKSKRSHTRLYNHQSAYWFSNNSLMSRKPPEMGGKAAVCRRRGQFSAPASMRTSPANSGIINLASGCVSSPTNSTSESTMEELHAAIQAAIAHCKNSIAMEGKIRPQN